MRGTFSAWPTEAQLGMTLNTRNLELMLRSLPACPLDEGQGVQPQLYDATKDHRASAGPVHGGPRNTTASPGTACGRSPGRSSARRAPAPPPARPKRSASPGRLPTPIPHRRCASARLLPSFHGAVPGYCGLHGPADREALFKALLPLHEGLGHARFGKFENVDLQFDLVVSASCFAQLKRHRRPSHDARTYDQPST